MSGNDQKAPRPMLDEILEMFGRKKRAGGTQPGGLGGMLSRVQGALDDDGRRHAHGDDRLHRDDRNDRDRDDPLEYGIDRYDRRGRRRERDGFDFGDD